MRYTGPKNRIARREGVDLGLKTAGSKSQASLLKKVTVPPGQHGAKGKRKTSEHGKQLREKQKVRYIFGLTEHQLSNYFQKSKRKTGNTGLYLSQYLERRLDNIVYRLGFAPTRASSRQLIAHKHMKVNDKIVSAASYLVKVGDVVTFAKVSTTKIPAIEKALVAEEFIMPAWLDKKGTVGKLNTEPTAEILEKQVNLRLVIEFYSK